MSLLKQKFLNYFHNDVRPEFAKMDLTVTIGVVATIFITILAILSIKMILTKSFSKYQKNQNFVFSLLKPSKFLFLTLGLTFIAELTYTGREGDFISNLIDNSRIIGVVFCVTWFCMNLIRELEKAHLGSLTQAKRYRDRTTVKAVTKLIKITLYIAVALICFKSIGIDVSSLLAIAGIGTAAIGLAARDFFSNFFATFAIYIDKPFVEGDWITSSDRNLEGTVEEIGWRMTKMSSTEKGVIYVPNSIFGTITIQNNSKTRIRKIKKIINIDYKHVSSVKKITDQIYKMIETHIGIEQYLEKYVSLINFSNHSIEIEIYAYSKIAGIEEFHDIQEDVLLKIADIIKKEKANFAVLNYQLETSGPNQKS